MKKDIRGLSVTLETSRLARSVLQLCLLEPAEA